jgi:hypothetical protein
MKALDDETWPKSGCRSTRRPVVSDSRPTCSGCVLPSPCEHLSGWTANAERQLYGGPPNGIIATVHVTIINIEGPAVAARLPGDRSTLLRQWMVLRAIAAAAGKATIKMLVEQTGKSEKTIRRDVSLLQRVGFPITETTGDFGRKMFAVDAADLPRVDLCYDEALALFFCRRAARLRRPP